jgi:hypothetical protein
VRRLAVLTSDFSLYHDLVKHLREHQVPFASLSFGEAPGPDIGVILTGWRDTLRADLPKGIPVLGVPVGIDGHEDVAAAVLQAQRVLEGVPGYNELVIGIDPGKRPGFAVLGDGRLLQTAQVFRIDEAVPLLRKLIDHYPADAYVVRLGHGSPRERDHILRGFEAIDRQDVRLQLVDETGTTLPPGRRKHLPSDVAAAVEIARTPGRPPRRLRSAVSSGEIREIQRESRELTLGQFTISRDQARRVAKEEVSLREAIEEEQEFMRRKSRSSNP